MAIIFVCSIGDIQSVVQTKAADLELLFLDTTVQSEKCIKLRWWKEKKATSYVIYRKSFDYHGESFDYHKKGKYKKIATVSSKKNSYADKTVKAKKWYVYKVVGYKKKKKVASSIIGVENTAKPTIYWKEWVECSVEAAPNSVKLAWYLSGGVPPEGYEVYRSDDGKKFKKIRTKNKKYEAIDENVKPKHTYYYKVRGYYKSAGKKTYTAFSEVTKKKTINMAGKYQVRRVEEQNVSPSAITLEITSDKYNGNLILDADGEWNVLCEKDEEGDLYSYLFVYGSGSILGYSTDGKDWKEGKNVTIRPGETVFVRFQIMDEEGNQVDVTSMTSLTFELYDGKDDTKYASHKYTPCIYFDAIKDTSFEAYIDGENYL